MIGRRHGLRAARVLGAVWLGGCINFRTTAGSDDESGVETRRPPAACAPAEPAWSAALSLQETTEGSVHELITCGGLQISLSREIISMLIASNEELLRDEERSLVAEYLSNPFTHAEDGSWTMEIPDSPASSFTLRFYEPNGGRFIGDDVFDLSAYLEGVHVQSTLSFTEMLANPEKKNVFSYTWESEGPLAYLMSDGQPVPPAFDLELSLVDLIGDLGFPVGPRESADLGPFDSVLDVELDSLVDYDDDRGDSTVNYVVATRRDSVRHVAATASLDFDVDSIESTDGALDMAGDGANLRLVSTGTLAGTIVYSITGTDVALVVTSDFGEGVSYPDVAWSCPSAD